MPSTMRHNPSGQPVLGGKRHTACEAQEKDGERHGDPEGRALQIPLEIASAPRARVSQAPSPQPARSNSPNSAGPRAVIRGRRRMPTSRRAPEMREGV